MKWVLSLVLLAAALSCKKSDDDALPLGKRYAIEVVAGQPSMVRVTPAGGWKLNLEYPSRLEARGLPSGVEVKLDKTQGKLSEAELSFTVPAKPRESFEGQVYFAICNPKTCIPVHAPVRWTVAAAQ